jgi:hypothetical protein
VFDVSSLVLTYPFVVTFSLLDDLDEVYLPVLTLGLEVYALTGGSNMSSDDDKSISNSAS